MLRQIDVDFLLSTREKKKKFKRRWAARKSNKKKTKRIGRQASSRMASCRCAREIDESIIKDVLKSEYNSNQRKSCKGKIK
jgi:hypothetical protein